MINRLNDTVEAVVLQRYIVVIACWPTASNTVVGAVVVNRVLVIAMLFLKI
jgi:hypothetical protein